MATVVKKVIFESVTISFDEEEFAYLCTMLARTGGDPQKSLRGAAARIIKSLEDAGIEYFGYTRQREVDTETPARGSIYFKDRV